MALPKVHIIGAAGSGKTFAAKKLAELYGVTAFDLDELFWDQEHVHFGVPKDEQRRNEEFRAIVARDGWIIEGAYHEWVAPSFERADLIIALAPPVRVRYYRIIKRFCLRKMRLIPTKNESLRDIWAMLKWNRVYDSDNLVQARKMIERIGRPIVDCRSLKQVLAAVESRQPSAPQTASSASLAAP